MSLPAPRRHRNMDFLSQAGYGSWNDFFETYHPKMKRFALRFFHGDYAQAEDAAAETFYHVLHAADTFQEGKKVNPWMYSIARNVCRDLYKKEKKHRRVEELVEQEVPQVEMAEDPDLEQHINIVIENMLPRQFREVLYLVMQDYSYAKVAQQLDIPLGTVMSRLHRARHYLAPWKGDFL